MSTSLTVNKGAVPVFQQPKVTEYEYELTEHDHATVYHNITEGEISAVIQQKCLGGVNGTPYYYTENGVTYYDICNVISRDTTTVTYTVTLYDGTVLTEDRTYLTHFSARSSETSYLNQPSHVVRLVSSYYETPTRYTVNFVVDPTTGLPYYRSQSMGNLHLVFTVETLVYEYDGDGHVIGYHFEQSDVDYVNNSNAYGSYWVSNQGLAGNTVEIELDMAETIT